MVKLKCKKCNHEWDYKGKSEYYVTCPRCLTKVKVEKELKEDQDGNNE